MKGLTIFTAAVFAVSLGFSSAALAAGDSQARGGEYDQPIGQERPMMGQDQQAGAADSQQIRQVQETLSDKGYEVGPVDGIMGPQTSGALREFQQDEGLAATGQPDQQTLEALGVQEEFGISPAFDEERQERDGMETMDSEERESGQERQEQMREGETGTSR